jgi:hypothetical protein
MKIEIGENLSMLLGVVAFFLFLLGIIVIVYFTALHIEKEPREIQKETKCQRAFATMQSENYKLYRSNK